MIKCYIILFWKISIKERKQKNPWPSFPCYFSLSLPLLSLSAHCQKLKQIIRTDDSEIYFCKGNSVNEGSDYSPCVHACVCTLLCAKPCGVSCQIFIEMFTWHYTMDTRNTEMKKQALCGLHLYNLCVTWSVTLFYLVGPQCSCLYGQHRSMLTTKGGKDYVR